MTRIVPNNFGALIVKDARIYVASIAFLSVLAVRLMMNTPCAKIAAPWNPAKSAISVCVNRVSRNPIVTIFLSGARSALMVMAYAETVGTRLVIILKNAKDGAKNWLAKHALGNVNHVA